MSEETREQINAIILLLKNCMVENGVSLAVGKQSLYFFDTAKYLETHTYDGIAVRLEDNLVK